MRILSLNAWNWKAKLSWTIYFALLLNTFDIRSHVDIRWLQSFDLIGRFCPIFNFLLFRLQHLNNITFIILFFILVKRGLYKEMIFSEIVAALSFLSFLAIISNSFGLSGRTIDISLDGFVKRSLERMIVRYYDVIGAKVLRFLPLMQRTFTLQVNF